MADGWALETALLGGCYAVAAVAAAAGGSRRRGAPGASSEPLASPDQPAASRRRRRGKPRRGPGHADDDDASATTGGSWSAGSANTSARLSHSDAGTARSFASCLSNGSAMSSSSGAPPLPMCPDDRTCLLVNSPEHIATYAHTCRLPMCASANDPAHSRYFIHNSNNSGSPAGGSSSSLGGAPLPPPDDPVDSKHMDSSGASAPGTIAKGESTSGASWIPASVGSPPSSAAAFGGRGRGRRHGSSGSASPVLAIHAFSTWTAGEDTATNSDSASPVAAGHVHADLRPGAPRARPLQIQWQSLTDGALQAATVHGEWGRVRVHTLRQYLKQLTGVPPSAQVLSARGAESSASPPQRPLMGRGRAHSPPQAPAAPPTVVLLADDLATVADAVRPIRIADATIVVAAESPA